MRALGGRRAAAADPADGEPARLDGIARRLEPCRRLGQRRIGHQPGEAQPLEPVDELGQLGGLLRALNAGPPQPRVALDQEVDLEPVPGEHGRETQCDRCRISDDGHLHALRQRSEPLGLRGADQREREQDVLDAGVGHHLCFAELLAGDPDRTRLELQAGELGQLVRLDVRPQRDPVLVAVGLHPRDVSLDRVEVAGQHRRLELGDPHQPLACAARTPSRTAAVARAA